MPLGEPNPNDVFSLLGFAVCHAQTVEGMLRFCITFVLQKKDGPLTMEKLQSIRSDERKKGLGYFLEQVRRRSSIHPKFAETLETYLQQRNDMVHNHKNISGWDLDTEDGVKVIQLFLINFIRRGNHILEIFTALTRSWENQAGLQTSFPVDVDSYVEEIEKKSGHLIDDLFGHEES
ncbi:hypothetical protein [Pseudomonas sp. NPDC090201]|uniref:hypothetical protein n=1 Tax=Pseudomonas sp. NPDC090201 TaxID=3364475 RepID=UPI00380B013C